jgi:hypothetical protein
MDKDEFSGLKFGEQFGTAEYPEGPSTKKPEEMRGAERFGGLEMPETQQHRDETTTTEAAAPRVDITIETQSKDVQPEARVEEDANREKHEVSSEGEFRQPDEFADEHENEEERHGGKDLEHVTNEDERREKDTGKGRQKIGCFHSRVLLGISVNFF